MMRPTHAVGEHVEVIVVQFAGYTRSRRAFEDEAHQISRSLKSFPDE